ncbi:uncharacterized protein LOC144104104 isoform X3 [Amblyomma americanum]
MPPGSMQYRLVGFAPELDWRPLHFLKPLPPNRVCSACGLVRQKTALLSCAHTLCESCYGQCAEAGLHVCPLDGYECQDEDIICVDFPAEDLLRRGRHLTCQRLKDEVRARPDNVLSYAYHPKLSYLDMCHDVRQQQQRPWLYRRADASASRLPFSPARIMLLHE